MYFFRSFCFLVLISQSFNVSCSSYFDFSSFFNSKKKKTMWAIFGISLTAYLFYKFFYKTEKKKNKIGNKKLEDLFKKIGNNTRIELSELLPTTTSKNGSFYKDYVERNENSKKSQYSEMLKKTVEKGKIEKLFHNIPNRSLGFEGNFLKLEGDYGKGGVVDSIKKSLEIDQNFLNLYCETFPFLANNKIFCSKTCAIVINFVHEKKREIFNTTFFEIQAHLLEQIINDEHFEFDNDSKLAIKELLTNFLDTEKNDSLDQISTVQLLRLLGLYFQSGAAIKEETVEIIDKVIKFCSTINPQKNLLGTRFSRLLESQNLSNADLNLIEKSIVVMFDSLQFDCDLEIRAYNKICSLIEHIFKKSSLTRQLKKRMPFSDQEFKTYKTLSCLMIKASTVLPKDKKYLFRANINANFNDSWKILADLCIQNAENFDVMQHNNEVYFLHQLFQAWQSDIKGIVNFYNSFFIPEGLYENRWRVLANYLLRNNIANDSRDQIVDFYNAAFDLINIKIEIKDKFWSYIFYEIVKNHQKIEEDWIIAFNKKINPSLFYCIKKIGNPIAGFFRSKEIAIEIVQQKIDSIFEWNDAKTECLINIEKYSSHFLIFDAQNAKSFVFAICDLCNTNESEFGEIRESKRKLLQDLYQMFLLFSLIETEDALVTKSSEKKIVIVEEIKNHANTQKKFLKETIEAEKFGEICAQVEQALNIENFLIPHNKVIKSENLLVSYSEDKDISFVLQLHLGLIFEKNRKVIQETFNTIKNFKIENETKYNYFKRFNNLASLFVGDMIKTVKENNEERLKCLQFFSENFKQVPDVFDKNINPEDLNSIQNACFGFENEKWFDEGQNITFSEQKITNMDKLYTVIHGMQNNTSLYAQHAIDQLAKQTIFQDNSYARFIATTYFPELDFNKKQNIQIENIN